MSPAPTSYPTKRLFTVRTIASSAVAIGALVALAGCGVVTTSTPNSAAALDRSTAQSPAGAVGYSVDGGDASRPEVRLRGWVDNGKASKKYRIAFVYDSPANAYELANYYGIEAAAKSLGVDLVEVKHEAFSAEAQVNAIQQIIQNKSQYDGVIVGPDDPAGECKLLSQDVPAAGLPVVVVNYPLCQSENYTPGTVGLSSSQSPTSYVTYVDWALQKLEAKGGGKVGVLTGPAAFGQTLDLKAALDSEVSKYPNIQVTQVLSGDYSAAMGLSQAQTLLQSDPDLSMILTNYDQITVGAQKALAAAGKGPGDVELFNLGGDTTTFDLMRSGWIQGTFYAEPAEETAQGLELLVGYLDGSAVPAFNNLALDPTLPDQSALVTIDNIDKYKPES